jgi:hypothetical protein
MLRLVFVLALVGCATARHTVEAPKEEEQPAPTTSDVPAGPTGTEELSVGQIVTGVKAVTPALVRCFTGPGEMKIRFTVEPTGRVSRAEVRDMVSIDAAEAACMEKAMVESARFDSVDGPPRTLTVGPFRAR